MRLRQIAPLALILAGAVACTSSGSGGTTPAPTSRLPTSSVATTTSPAATPSISPSPTPTVATTGPNVRPGEKPPTVTVGARSHTPAGALQFSIVWLRALDWGYATTDSTLARSLFTQSCSECERFASIFDMAKLAGNHFRNGRIRLRSNTLISDDSRHPGTTPVDVIFNQAALQVIAKTGNETASEPPQSGVRYREWLRWKVTSGWTVIDLKQVVVKK